MLEEKAMAPHSSTLAWKIPWTEEPRRLQTVGSLRVGNNWATSFHFSLSCIGEGNGNPLQYSCLENPRDGGAWWASIYGVTQSWTQLKQLSSSSYMLDMPTLGSDPMKWSPLAGLKTTGAYQRVVRNWDSTLKEHAYRLAYSQSQCWGSRLKIAWGSPHAKATPEHSPHPHWAPVAVPLAPTLLPLRGRWP